MTGTLILSWIKAPFKTQLGLWLKFFLPHFSFQSPTELWLKIAGLDLRAREKVVASPVAGRPELSGLGGLTAMTRRLQPFRAKR